MNPSLAILVEIVVFAVALWLFMYFVAVRGPIADKVKEWIVEARKARKKRAKKGKASKKDKAGKN